MTLTVRFDPAAEEELDAAHDWYERESPGVGAEFVIEVRQAAKQAADWPGIGLPEEVPGTSREIRRAVVQRFPYGVVYLVLDDILWVVAVAHHRRRPGYWHDRVLP